MNQLTIDEFKQNIKTFVRDMSQRDIPNLFGITDGKAIGTYVELEFNRYLSERFTYQLGNAALGIDFPELLIDLKVTSIRQPQSSCPFRSADQKIYGLGYHLVILVYDKLDNPTSQTARLNFQDAVFVAKDRTGDFQTTKGLIEILSRNANLDDIIAFLEERNLPLDEIGRMKLGEQILQNPPVEGYLTISNALQWRLQYNRVLTLAHTQDVLGVDNLLT